MSDEVLVSVKREVEQSEPENHLKQDTTLQPFYDSGHWYLYLTVPGGGLMKMPGVVTKSQRCRGRTTLVFKTAWDQLPRKYNLCEYCPFINWVYYRNYICQHVRRHHPDKCYTCTVCNQLIEQNQMKFHNCRKRMMTKALKVNSINLYAEIEKPTRRRVSPATDADDLELCLQVVGHPVAKGSLAPTIGVPVSGGTTIKQCFDQFEPRALTVTNVRGARVTAPKNIGPSWSPLPLLKTMPSSPPPPTERLATETPLTVQEPYIDEVERPWSMDDDAVHHRATGLLELTNTDIPFPAIENTCEDPLLDSRGVNVSDDVAMSFF